MNESSKELLGGLGLASLGLVIFPPAALVGAALVVRACRTNDKELSEKRKKERRSNMPNFNTNLPASRDLFSWDTPASFTSHLPTPIYYGQQKTQEDVDIGKFIADFRKRESDNNTVRDITRDLLYSPVVLEAQRTRPSLSSISVTTRSTTKKRGFLGFMYVTEENIHESRIDFK